MSFSVQRSGAFLLAQTREFYREFGTLFLNIIFPLMFVSALIFTHYMSPSFKFEMGVVEVRQDRASQQFVQALAASPSVAIRSLPSREAAAAAVKEGELHAAFVVADARFEQNQGRIDLIVGPRYEDFSRLMLDAARDRMRSGPTAPDGSGAAPSLFDYKLSSLDMPEQSDFTFTFPGMLALALVQLGLFATAVPLLQARDRGTLKYLSLTPLTRAELLIGQLGMRVTIALVQIAAILAAGSMVVSLSGAQWAATMGASLLGVLLLVSIGYAIAGCAGSLQSGMAIILFANFSMLIGGNIFMDPSASTIQYAAACIIPISYLADLFRQIITGQAGLWPIWVDVAAVLAWSALAIAIALRTFRFDTDLKTQRGGFLSRRLQTA
jgi:ABC-2 type transport system permease protein